MKRYVKIINIIYLLAILSISVLASDIQINKYEQEDITITIDNPNISKDEYNKMVQYLLTGEQVTTHNILYSLLGHSWGSPNIGTKTTHSVYSSDPRCKKETYSITTCTRCGEYSSIIIATNSVSCCP